MSKPTESHAEFRERLLATPKDISLPIFQELMGQGYTDYRVNCSPSATDTVCLVGGGETGTIADLLNTTQYEAPCFSHRHVGCQCLWACTGPDLPEVMVGAFGIVE